MEGSIHFKNNKNKLPIEYLYKIIENSERQFDKLMILINTGGISLIFGINNKLLPVKVIESCPNVIIALSCFIASLIIVLLSHRTAILAYGMIIENKNAKWNTITIYLNWISIISLIFGIIFLALSIF
jgi:hypothetical protein